MVVVGGERKRGGREEERQLEKMGKKRM